MAEYLGQERIYVRSGDVYIIRDVWAAPVDSEEWRKMHAERFIRCEYAVAVGGRWATELEWHPCEQGVRFDAIQPAFTVTQLEDFDELQSHQQLMPPSADEQLEDLVSARKAS